MRIFRLLKYSLSVYFLLSIMLFSLKAQITNVQVFLRDINFEISLIPSDRENKIDIFVQKNDLIFQQKELKPDSIIKLSHILVDRFGQGTVTYSKNINKLIIIKK